MISERIQGNIVAGIIETLREYCYVEDIFTDGDIITYVSENMDPNRVFDDKVLEQWATDNGFTKQGE